MEKETAKETVSKNFIEQIIEKDLAEGKYDEICTRFPPEPNGYLHIGHAKSILLNYGLAQKYHGKFNMRFDDTNPTKEKVEFVESIKKDIQWLGADWEDRLYFASNYFEQMYEAAVKLIKKGKAFVCDLTAEEIREYRGTLTEPGKESPYRNRSVEENLELFEKMKNGEFKDGSKVLRAKIDMASPNINMRDPVIYRVAHMTHHNTGDKWCIYPMYDFAHPIEDAIEGVTHSICTLEFEDHRPLYDWVVQELEYAHPPKQIEFAKLYLTNVVTGKRYIKKLVEDGIDKYLRELTYPEVIAEGMKYAVLNGGKRLRPILLFMTLDILGCEREKGLATASAIEMIHSYSLVHDDLPALDNDDYRRGKLTTHKKFGEAEGILIGDALLTHAFYVLTEKNSHLSADKIVEIVKLTSSYAGINGMIGGQMVDIASEGKKIDLETLRYMHAHKTGKLIKLPVEVACVIADASIEDREVLTKYSELIGLAFQIKDDILDIEGDFETIGKPVGSDLEHDKSTYPSILGMAESKKLLSETIEEAKSIIRARFGEERSKTLLDLADYIGNRDK